MQKIADAGSDLLKSRDAGARRPHRAQIKTRGIPEAGPQRFRRQHLAGPQRVALTLDGGDDNLFRGLDGPEELLSLPQCVKAQPLDISRHPPKVAGQG